MYYASLSAPALRRECEQLQSLLTHGRLLNYERPITVNRETIRQRLAEITRLIGPRLVDGRAS